MNDPHMNLVSAIVRADKAVNEMALALARLKGSIKDAVEYEPPEPSKSEGGTDECPSCKGNDKNSRLVMDATLGMDYECSDDWHTAEGGGDE